MNISVEKRLYKVGDTVQLNSGEIVVIHDTDGRAEPVCNYWYQIAIGNTVGCWVPELAIVKKMTAVDLKILYQKKLERMVDLVAPTWQRKAGVVTGLGCVGFCAELLQEIDRKVELHGVTL